MNGTYLTKRTAEIFKGDELPEAAFITFCEIDPDKQDLGTPIKFGPPINGLIHKVADHEMLILHHDCRSTSITTTQLQNVGSISDGMKYKILGVMKQAY